MCDNDDSINLSGGTGISQTTPDMGSLISDMATTVDMSACADEMILNLSGEQPTPSSMTTGSNMSSSSYTFETCTPSSMTTGSNMSGLENENRPRPIVETCTPTTQEMMLNLCGARCREEAGIGGTPDLCKRPRPNPVSPNPCDIPLPPSPSNTSVPLLTGITSDQ